jgi:ABC-type multidrug transport system fused ATPase/permease subunit
VLASLSDALVALGRISKFLNAEELSEPYNINYKMKHAVTIDADFSWETAGKLEENKFAISAGRRMGREARKKGREAKRKAKSDPVLPTAVQTIPEGPPKEPEEKPFELKGLKFSVPKGAFVAIVGRVGSGKVCLQIIPGRFPG